MHACYRPPNQEEVVDEAFFRQLEETSCLQALLLMRSLNHPDTCWKGNAAGRKHSRRPALVKIS